MNQEVLYRRWRPRSFSAVVGQEPVTTTLRNAVAAASPSHAYLFAGPRGTGKTSTGRILAKAVNCTAPTPEGEPDNACSSCLSFDEGRALDLIELDAASNRGIDEIRDLREGTGYAPNSARYKVYLIDEVHMLTDAAFNALLKTLEEPPPHVIFVLATTEAQRLPATITSRCQRFDFRRIPLAEAVQQLRRVCEGEGMQVDDASLDLIARQATGSLRDAINLLDQMSVYFGHELTLEAVRSGLGLTVDDRTSALARAAIAKDLAAGLAALGAARADGVEMRAFMRATVATLRNALLVKAGGGDQLTLSDPEMESLRALAQPAQVTDIVAALRAFGSIDFAGDAYDSLPAEIAFATLAVGPDPIAATPEPAAASTPQQRSAAPRQQRSGQGGARQQRRPDQQPSSTRARPASGAAGDRPSREGDAGGAAPAARPKAAAPAVPPQYVPPDEGEVSPELAALRAQWEQIRDAARSRHYKAGAFLKSCNIKTFDGDRVEVGFRFAAHVDLVVNAEDGRVMEAIRDSVVDAVGRSVEVSAVVWEQLEGVARAAPTRSTGGHMLEEALKQGAELIKE